MSQDNKWTKAAQPPPPMFIGGKEKDLVKQVNDEITERVVGQQVLYFAIYVEHTNLEIPGRLTLVKTPLWTKKSD